MSSAVERSLGQLIYNTLMALRETVGGATLLMELWSSTRDISVLLNTSLTPSSS